VITGNSITHGSNGVSLTRSGGNINISGNRIAMDLQGITLAYVNYYSSDNKYALISNNMIATNRNDVTNPGNGGIYLHHSDHVKVYFNTSVYYINHYDNSIAINLRNCEGSSIEVVNNNLVCLHDGYAFYSDQNTGALARCDNNNYYTAGTGLGVWAGTDCNDLSALKTTSGDNAHSVSTDPGFVSDTDLHVTSAVLDSAGVPVQGITEDIDGDLRDPQYPDIGADEFGAVPAEHPPVAVNDTTEVVQGNGVEIAVLDNDSDPDGDPIHVTGTGTPAQGQVTGIANDTVKYLTPMDFTGMDSVIYTIRDTTGLEDSAWIFINVEVSSNHPPVAVNDYAVVLQGGQVSVDLLSNDHDPDGDSIYVSQLHSFLQGSAVLIDNHYIVYTAPENYTGVDSLEYILEDIHGAIGVAWVYITVKAESFEPSDIELDPLSLGVGVWVDYDTDGDMDILTGGVTTGNAYEVKLYENDNGSFISSSVITQVAPEQFDAVAWGDFDNDGVPDLIVSGYENAGVIRSHMTRLFHVENGQFTEIISGIDMRNSGSVDWGDFDNDGDLDLLTGGDNTKIYRNDGAGEYGQWVFTEVKSLPAAREGSAKWGDYDGDGDLDILLSSTVTTGEKKIWMYRNDSNGDFTEINTGIENVVGRCIWFDYNHDGYPDIIFEGRENDTLATKIYRNDPDNAARKFTDIEAGLKGLEAGSISFCDYDLDGDADLLVTGRDAEGKSWTILYDYLSNGRFMESGVTLPGVEWGNGKWGDFNGDGKPDLLLLGYRNDPGNPGVNGAYTGVFINMTSGTNTPPSTPTNLSVEITGTSVMLSWRPATDLQSLARGLTYNLRVGTTTGGSEIMSAIANPATGVLYVPETGNIGYNLQWKINNLQLGRNYWWSVQAIDPSYAGSSFAQEKSFKLEGEYFAENPLLVLKGLTYGDIAWGDYDNDGDPDLAMSGMTKGGSYVSAIYKNNSGAFTDIGAGLQDVWKSSLDWGDFDNDGDIDLLLTGNTSEDILSGIEKIYRNDGNNVFTDIQAVLINAGDGDAVWGDYDNDGDLDILITGNYTNEIKVSKIFRNNDGIFQLDTDAGLEGVSNSSVSWGDYDKDGDLDILLSGLNNSGYEMTRIFRNDAGIFTEDSNVHLPGIYDGSVAWGDYNNDGAPDILMTGKSSEEVLKTRVYRNDLNSHFTEIDAQLDDVENGSVAWGDVDADGRLDIFMAGSSLTCVYLNTPSGFHKKSVLPGINYGSLAVADYNQDGRLDFILSGENETHESVCKIYYNINTIHNHAPEVPDGLAAINQGSALVFQWNKGHDQETPDDGLSYNLRIGTTPGGSEIMSGMADPTTGARKIVQTGNVNQNCSWKISGLETGTTYYWSVQAIDHNYCGSAFALEQSVTWVPSHTVIGEIFLYSQMQATMTKVWALSINDEGWVSNIVSANLTGTNRYEIHGIPEGRTTIEVFPVQWAYPDYLPTYLGSTKIFENADIFDLDKDTSVANIYLVHKPQSNSGWYNFGGSLACSCVGDCIGCSIQSHVNVIHKSTQANTTMISGTYIYLLNNKEDIITWAITDSLGDFLMDSIPEGKYTLYIDLVGLPIISDNDTIVFNEDHPEYKIAAVAGDTAIYVTFLDVTAVDLQEIDPGITVYPNPVKDNLYLKLNDTNSSRIVITIISIDGALIKEISTADNELLTIPVSDLRKGIYILKVKGQHLVYQTKFIKQ
jgi:hypothetical protein